MVTIEVFTKEQAMKLLDRIGPYILICEISGFTDKYLEIWPDGCYMELADLCECITAEEGRYVPEGWRIVIDYSWGISIRKKVVKNEFDIVYSARIPFPKVRRRLGRASFDEVYAPYINSVYITVYEGGHIRGEGNYVADWRSFQGTNYVTFAPNYLRYPIAVPYGYDLIPEETSEVVEKLVSPDDVREFINEAVNVLPSFDPHCLLIRKSLLVLYP